jgi:hypothetical protein
MFAAMPFTSAPDARISSTAASSFSGRRPETVSA